MTKVATVAFGSSRLFLEGLRSLLSESCFEVRVMSTELHQWNGGELGDGVPQLVIFGLPNFVHPYEELVQARAQFPGCRIVVLTRRANPEHFLKCLEADVDGYLASSISSEALIESLRLVMLGEKVYPTILATWFAEGRSAPNRAGSPHLDKAELSKRETEVLRLLVRGVANKTIATELSIAESTVKLHVHRILKKINASNRTQAALWARNGGLSGVVA